MSGTATASANPCIGATLRELIEALVLRESMIQSGGGHLLEVEQESAQFVIVGDFASLTIDKGKSRGRGKEGEPGFEPAGLPYESVKLAPMTDPESKMGWGIPVQLDRFKGVPVDPESCTLLQGHLLTGQVRLKLTGSVQTQKPDKEGKVMDAKTARKVVTKFNPFSVVAPSDEQRAANKALADEAANARLATAKAGEAS